MGCHWHRVGWLGLFLASCAPSAPPWRSPLAGGALTLADRTTNAFSFPAPGLSDEELELHLEGDVEIEATFVTPPAIRNAGLGPLFNNNSCNKCHVRDGRGMPAAGVGPLGSPLTLQISLGSGRPEVPGGPVPVPGLGVQLQDHAVFGAAPEATVVLRWLEEQGEYGDGEPFALRRPVLEVTLPDGGPLGGEVLVSSRIPPPLIGLGLLEAVPEATLLALADPEDADGDGISGRLNRVWDAARGTAPGRFGWKANVSGLLEQAALDYRESMGVATPRFPEADGGLEVDAHRLEAAAHYTRTLAVPQRGAWAGVQVERGELVFRELGCAACHVEALRTGDHPLGPLREQVIHPYTDLLLHNVGFDLADGRPDALASGTEWRTAPLWGLGLAHTVLPFSGFLHDGRARTIEEAILWHGGEAERSREQFRTATARDRQALAAFLRSL